MCVAGGVVVCAAHATAHDHRRVSDSHGASARVRCELASPPSRWMGPSPAQRKGLQGREAGAHLGTPRGEGVLLALHSHADSTLPCTSSRTAVPNLATFDFCPRCDTRPLPFRVAARPERRCSRRRHPIQRVVSVARARVSLAEAPSVRAIRLSAHTERCRRGRVTSRSPNPHGHAPPHSARFTSHLSTSMYIHGRRAHPARLSEHRQPPLHPLRPVARAQASGSPMYTPGVGLQHDHAAHHDDAVRG